MKLQGVPRRLVLHFECAIEDSVRAFANGLERQARVLDAGAGECQYAHWFSGQRYTAIDLAVGDSAWNYSGLDAICDLTAISLADGCFDAAINIVTLEHVREPARALREIARTLRPGAPLLLVVPFEWEVHQEPQDYFRFTRYGLDYLLRRAGFAHREIRPVGGYFRLLSRRLYSGIQFFMSGWRWVGFPIVALALAPLALAAPLLDGLDKKKAFTLGYICIARRGLTDDLGSPRSPSDVASSLEEQAQVQPPGTAERLVPPTKGAAPVRSCASEGHAQGGSRPRLRSGEFMEGMPARDSALCASGDAKRLGESRAD